MFFKPNVEKLKRNRDIKGLVKALRDTRKVKDKVISDLAADALIELGDQSAVPELIKIVEQTTPKPTDLRAYGLTNAIRVLGHLKDSDAIPALVNALSKSVGFRIGAHPAVEALSKIVDKTSIPLLLNLLRSGEKSVQKQVSRVFGKLRAKEAVPILLGLLDDPDLCSTAVCSLADIGDTSVVPKLVDLAKTADIPTRRGIFAALIVLKETTGLATPLAIETLTNDLQSGLRERAHGFALHYLCTLNDPAVVDHLIAGLPALTNGFCWTIVMELGVGVPNSYRWVAPLINCLNAISTLGGKDCIPKLENLRTRLEREARQYANADRKTQRIRSSLSKTIEELKKQ